LFRLDKIIRSTSFNILFDNLISELLIGSGSDRDKLFICIENIKFGGDNLLNKWCSDGSSLEQSSNDDLPVTIEPLYVAEILQVDEGWLFPVTNTNLKINLTAFVFDKSHIRIVGIPQHGSVLVRGKPENDFTYQDLLLLHVNYSHDGSETSEDAIELQVNISGLMKSLIRINPINDAPELRKGSEGLRIKYRNCRLLLDTRFMNLWDSDTDSDIVRVDIVSANGVILQAAGHNITQFSQQDFINNKIHLVNTGEDRGEIHLIANDGEKQSSPLLISVITVPIEIHLKSNTGVKVMHQSSETILPANLSFTTNLPDLPLQYMIVDLPEYGLVECCDDVGQYQICSSFMQNDIEQSRIRYRHTSQLNPPVDSFSFQVRAGSSSSIVHFFKISFIPVHVKIFNRAPFLLNSTDQLTLRRLHLFAWTFPKSYSPQNLIFHVIEPPKFGLLSRRISETRNRRIGVSSNFTQQYSIVNDFFIFRVITPSVASEATRFEITFIPGSGAVQLINRTIVVDEGAMQKITNESLSLETPDDNNFMFTIGIPPLFGNIVLSHPLGAKFILSMGENFTTQDINKGRVWYEHLGVESRVDRVYLVAESVHRHTSRIPFWLTMRMILKNDNTPRLVGKNELQIIDRGDRILRESLLPWKDDDIDTQPLRFIFHDGFRNAAILSRVSPNIHIRNFTQQDMKNEEIMIRHLGHSKHFQMSYTVSDGVHDVPSVLTVIASEPFIRFENHHVYLPPSETDLLLTLTNQNLSAITNFDVGPADIVFFVTHSQNFLIMHNSSEFIAKNFTQKDINDGKIFYRSLVSDLTDEQISVQVDKQIDTVAFRKLRQQSLRRSSIEMRTLSVLVVPISSLSQIDKNILFASAPGKTPSEIIYDVLKQPNSGSLILESVKGIIKQFLT
uniref:TMEM131_like domain-containing protein n=1 Tax=Dracunculus medinensis TaxID=318479 RepID=A0A0N4UG62_DRAME